MQLPFKGTSLWTQLDYRTSMGTTWDQDHSKEDLGCSTEEMVYGTPLTVLGDFVTSQNNHLDTGRHLPELQSQVKLLLPVPTSRHGRARTAVLKTLMCTNFVFIHRDSHHSPLQHLYEGPFRVIESGLKIFQISVRGKCETISIDHLKPEYIYEGDPPKVVAPGLDNPPNPQPAYPLTPNPQSVQVQRIQSGRQIRPPRRYVPVLGGEWCSGNNLRIY